MLTQKEPSKDGPTSNSPRYSTTSYDYIARLQDCMTAAGMPYTGKGALKTDGTVNRWDTNGRRNGPLWCFVHELSSGHVAAAFGDWRTASSHHFKSWENGHAVDPNEAQRLLDELDRRRKLAEEQETKSKGQVAKRAQEQWSYLPETGSSAYLERKQVQAFGIRYGANYHGNFIAVPMRDVSGTLRAFQRIYDDGTKRFPKGSEKKGCYHLIGDLDPTGEIYLAEGYATAATIHQATGKPVIVCFDAGNIRAVADALKTVYPDLRLIVAADNDQWKADETGPDGKPKGNTGIKAAYAVAHAHPGTRVAIPSFDNLDTSDKPTDFNDLARLAGREHVSRQLERAKEPKPRGNGEDKARDRKSPIEHSDPHQAQAASRRYSLQFAVAGHQQQPQSSVADILAEHNSGLVYDHTAQKWMQYVDTQWKEITDTAAFKVVKKWIDAGLDGEGYTISFINGIIAFLKALLATDGFDDNPRLVPFQNGVLDLSTMRLMEHSPELKIAWCLPFNYDPAATCEPVIAWLKESVGGDDLQVELLRAYIKAILTGRYDLQRYLELIGPGGSGKGVFTDLCVKLVGKNNVHVTELKHLETNRFETARLYRKRLCIITDASKYAGDVSTLKAMTGKDDLRFEEKHKQGGESFKFQGMVLIAANQEIGSSDLTSGLQRRRITVRFDNQVAPAKRRNLEKEFEPYLPGVIAWALSLDDARMKELLVETDTAVPMVGGFNLETLKRVNPLAAWTDECLILDSRAETPIGSVKKYNEMQKITDVDSETRTIIEHADDWLYPNYVEWCSTKGSKPASSVHFTGLLKDLLCCQLKIEGIEKLERAGAKLSRFKGIRLRTEEDQDIGNLIEYGLVRVRYGLGTGCMVEGTGSTDKSKFSNTAHAHDENQQVDGSNENADGGYMGKSSNISVQTVPSVLNEQNQSVIENTTVPDPYKPVPDPYGDQPEPPDIGPGYMDGLVAAADFQAAPPAHGVTDEPVAAGKLPRRCDKCHRYYRMSRNCGALPGVAIENTALPPCMGRFFQPKEGRQ